MFRHMTCWRNYWLNIGGCRDAIKPFLLCCQIFGEKMHLHIKVFSLQKFLRLQNKSGNQLSVKICNSNKNSKKFKSNLTWHDGMINVFNIMPLTEMVSCECCWCTWPECRECWVLAELSSPLFPSSRTVFPLRPLALPETRVRPSDHGAGLWDGMVSKCLKIPWKYLQNVSKYPGNISKMYQNALEISSSNYQNYEHPWPSPVLDKNDSLMSTIWKAHT